MIKKTKNKYCVYNHTGKKMLGCHKTKSKALKQLRAIEINKKKHSIYKNTNKKIYL